MFCLIDTPDWEGKNEQGEKMISKEGTARSNIYEIEIIAIDQDIETECHSVHVEIQHDISQGGRGIG